MSDWYADETGGPESKTPGDDLDLSDLDWSGSPSAPQAAPEPYPEEPAADSTRRMPVVERPAAAPVRRQGSHSMGRRTSTGALWGWLALAFIIGLALGIGGLFWQRGALLGDIRSLESKLTAAEESSTASAQQLADAQTQLAAAETSVAGLTAQNTQLTSELASATAALAAAKTSVATTVSVIERSATPASVDASKTITFLAKVEGKATKVQVKVVGTGGITYTKYYSLVKVSTSGGIDTWKRAVTAPGTKGTYRYYVTAYVGTKAYTMAGTTVPTFTVK